MATTEPTINDALASLLRVTRRAWNQVSIVRSENTGTLEGSNGRPDILIAEPTVSPVVIETEVLPAVSVEKEARSRLGFNLKSTGRAILSSVAVRLPRRIRSHQGEHLLSELNAAQDLEFVLFTGSSSTSSVRHPKAGWMSGSVRDLSILAQAASVPPDVIDRAADKLVLGVTVAAAILQELKPTHPGALAKIAEALKQDSSEQTSRMAATMLANALVFQESLANGPGELVNVRSLDEIRTTAGGFPKSEVLGEWNKILEVNYWPIFDIARRILEVIPASTSGTLIERLAKTAEQLLESRLMRSHDLTGAVFQRLISDRKFLAAYYTRPESASLLVGLAITLTAPLSKAEWSDPRKVKALRIADFSCGTGTLLSTAYMRIGQNHELAGGDSEAIHPEMMAYCLVGCDVLPAAAHLTASMLAGSHPTINYRKSAVLTVAYGVLGKGRVATGSLDLLDPQKKMEVLAITARAAGGTGESEEDIWATLPHQDFDLVIMNPPFVRATGQEGEKKGVPNPMFAAFAASEADQKQMGKALAMLSAGSSAHGNAGLASYFFVLADRKLKVGGVLALVMPLSLLSGEAWEECRITLASKYQDIVVLSIAGARSHDMSFSADTGMGECLVVARKATTGLTKPGEAVARTSEKGTFVVLRERPTSQLLGYNVAQQLTQVIADGKLKRLEDGPSGGTRISFGDDVVGQAVEADLPISGPWNPTRMFDLSLAQAAYQLTHCSLIWLPGMSQSQAVTVPMTTISNVGKLGPYHADIDGLTQNGGIRGPFEHVASENPQTSTYPILWNHDATRERCMCFEGDAEGLVRLGAAPDKVNSVWSSRSHCHFNQNFQFNSQSTGIQYTERQTLGGRAWISVKAKTASIEKALVAWGNTSLGLLIHWQHANKQQAGRGNIVPTSLASLPTLDFRKFTEEQIDVAAATFDVFRYKPLLPLEEIGVDSVRRELDEEFLSRVLGVPLSLLVDDGPIDLLRKKLGNEPSIVGRPGGQAKRKRKSI